MVTFNVLAIDEPQILLAVTETVPFVDITTAEMEFVFEAPDQLAGNVHVYEVALFTGIMLYVFKLESQTLVSPLIVPAIMGTDVFTVTESDIEGDEPQLLFAVTETLPVVAPAIVDIEFDVEVPVQSDGNDHV
jgi:hypothetical protein